jgi:hypothetical protein
MFFGPTSINLLFLKKRIVPPEMNKRSWATSASPHLLQSPPRLQHCLPQSIPWHHTPFSVPYAKPWYASSMLRASLLPQSRVYTFWSTREYIHASAESLIGFWPGLPRAEQDSLHTPTLIEKDLPAAVRRCRPNCERSHRECSSKNSKYTGTVEKLVVTGSPMAARNTPCKHRPSWLRASDRTLRVCLARGHGGCGILARDHNCGMTGLRVDAESCDTASKPHSIMQKPPGHEPHVQTESKMACHLSSP